MALTGAAKLTFKIIWKVKRRNGVVKIKLKRHFDKRTSSSYSSRNIFQKKTINRGRNGKSR